MGKVYTYSILFFCFFLFACSGHTDHKEDEVALFADLPQLQERGELVAVTLYSSTSYFQYKMQDMGYEYDLPPTSSIAVRRWGFSTSSASSLHAAWG